MMRVMRRPIFPAAGGGPPAFDAASSAYAEGNADITFSHTCTGSDRLLLVMASVNASDATSIAGATYNGVAMTLVTSIDNTDSFANTITYLFRLIAPATGANNIVVDVEGAPGNVAVSAASFTGVHQTTPLGTPVTGTGNNSDTPSVTVSGATGDLIVDFLGTLGNAISGTPGTGQTSRSSNPNAEASSFISTEAGAASVVMDWTLGAAKWSAQIGVAIKPV